jgi:hypothetical protein
VRTRRGKGGSWSFPSTFTGAASGTETVTGTGTETVTVTVPETVPETGTVTGIAETVPETVTAAPTCTVAFGREFVSRFKGDMGQRDSVAIDEGDSTESVGF